MFSLSNYSFNPHAVAPLVTALAVLFLGLIVVALEKGSRVSLLYIVYTLSASGWMFCASMAWFTRSEEVAFQWMKFANAAVTVIPASLYHFTVVALQTEKRDRHRVWLAWAVSTFFLAITLLTNVLFDSFYHYPWGLFVKYRRPAFLFVVYFFVMTVNILRLYWVEYRKSEPNTTKQRRSKAFLIAFGIGYLGAFDFLATLGLPYYPLSSAPMICMVILVARAIWRYRLVDITPAFAAPKIIDTMNDALMVFDSDRIIRVVNQATCSLLRSSEHDLVGKRPAQGMPRCREFAEQLESLIMHGAMRNRELDYPSEENGPRVLSVSTSVMRNARGEPLAMVALARDITERKLSERALRTSEERLSKAQRMAHVGNWEWDLVANQLWWSEEVYRIYGVDPASFVPSFDAVAKAMHPDDLKPFRKAVNAAIQEQKPFEMDYRLVRPDGTIRTVHTIGDVTYGPTGIPLTQSGTVQDVTDRKRVEKEREQLIEQLQEANVKLQSIDKMKTNFISMVSHELRTPLTTIKAFIELLLMKRGMAEQQKVKVMNTINIEADRLTRLINDLLDLARIEAGSMKWQLNEVSIEDITRSVIASMGVLFEKKGVRVTSTFSPSLARVSGDGDRMVQVVTNILSNAVKFTPAGGAIHVAVSQQSDPINQIVVEISDTGIGIPKGDLELIFEKFHRSGDKVIAGIEGTGLGLAITRQIIEHYGGRIWVTSTHGKGSVFTFTLPAGPIINQEASSE